MDELIQLLAAFAGSAGFALAFRFRGAKSVLSAGFGGFIGWLAYLIVFHISGNEYLAGYIGTIAVSVYAEIAARKLRMPATGFLIIGSIPMIPGAALYRCMHYMLLADSEMFRAEGLYTILFASSMAAGFVTTAILVHLTYYEK